jgi:hypothetical protein
MYAPEMRADAIARLERELAHVREPCQIAHRMAMSWRTRALPRVYSIMALQEP